MKKYSLLLLMPLLLLFSGKAQMQKRSLNKTLPSNSSMNGITRPAKLVYVIPNPDKGGHKYAGKLISETASSIEMKDFYFNSIWKLMKEKDERFSFVAPEEIISIKSVYVCEPNGPITNPSSKNLKNNDHAALCLSTGKVIYAKINGDFQLSSKKGYESAPGSGYIQFQEEYDHGKFYQIQLTWDAAMQKWLSKTDTYGPDPDIKNGAEVVAIYSYSELTTEFYNLYKTGAKNIPEVASDENNDQEPEPIEFTNGPQNLSMAKITFNDSKVFYANLMSQDASQVMIKIINNGAVYTISKKGVILNSAGKYPKGTKVQSVMLKKARESIYSEINQANFNYGTLGFEFPDGQVQYAGSLTVGTTFMSITMQHSNFNYQMYYKNGEWKIENTGGEYKSGTVIKDIFELAPTFKKFY